MLSLLQTMPSLICSWRKIAVGRYKRWQPKLRPGGILLATIRDYDRLIANPSDNSTPCFLWSSRQRRIVHQVWDWDGDEYDLHLYLSSKMLRRNGLSNITSRVITHYCETISLIHFSILGFTTIRVARTSRNIVLSAHRYRKKSKCKSPVSFRVASFVKKEPAQPSGLLVVLIGQSACRSVLSCRYAIPITVQSSFTESALFCSAACSSAVSLIWIICSSPFAPSLHGTPTYSPEIPYSPCR